MKLPFLLIWIISFFIVVDCRCPCTLDDVSVSCEYGSMTNFPSDMESKCPDIFWTHGNEVQSLDLQGTVFNLLTTYSMLGPGSNDIYNVCQDLSFRRKLRPCKFH